MRSLQVRRFFARNTYLFALLLLGIVLAINTALQQNPFELRVLNGNLRVFFPLMVLVGGQAIVVIGGGIDLSVGAMVSLCNVITVTWITPESQPNDIALAILLICCVGLAAGFVNGLAVAYLRLQPIVTTYATSFAFAGLALLILPRPGGELPRDMTRFYRSTPGNIPVTLLFAGLIVIVWLILRSTRYGQYLFATGSKADSAYATGLPVNLIRLSTYVLSGLFAALAGISIAMNTGSGSPRIGDAMTLDSIVAVVLGGTRLSGGRGGILGAMIGVIILGSIRNLISLADVPTWSQTLVNALIIIAALAGPGLLRLVRRRSA